jgi:hypothetical protein
MGDSILCGNPAEGFVMFTDTAHHVRPFFRWDAIVRPTLIWMLLYGRERGKTAEHLLEREQFLKELAVRGKEVDQHW